jgi:hypothetical protein
MEFSPDSHYLYVVSSTGSNSGHLFQYDATLADSAAFMQSEVFLGTGAGPMQSSTNGKNYLEASQAGSMTDSMHVINNPNEHGVACNYEKNLFNFNGILVILLQAPPTFQHKPPLRIFIQPRAIIPLNCMSGTMTTGTTQPGAG